MSYLTPEAKSKLSNTVRNLRSQLLTDLHNAIDSEYRLALPLEKAGLLEEQRIKRRRLEQWLDEQARGTTGKKQTARELALLTAEKLAAATLLNRLVVIKQMEAMELVKPAIVSGGWQSRGYREFRDFAPDLCRAEGDETEGYGLLLQLLFDELAQELPGLFGSVGVTVLFPIPARTLRGAIEELDALPQEVWLDDTTLGWVYQFWNDPEREALDSKLNAGGKVEPHEVALKTQMFTERYIVEWLLHNSLGQMWLAICKKNGWIPEVEADGTLEKLEKRRQEWRSQRENGEVALDALMPIEPGVERYWKYWVPQPLPDALIEHSPKSIQDIKIIDPACGSGHFLVIAFELLFALYQEEARHLGEDWSERSIVEKILENNLYGIDIDPRAVQIAVAALFLKAQSVCYSACPKHLNLVASNLQLGSMATNDPALVEFLKEVKEATGIPENLTYQIVKTLHHADSCGVLLKPDTSVNDAIQKYEDEIFPVAQGNLFTGFEPKREPLCPNQARLSILEKLEQFLALCTSGDDLGLRLRGEQLARGIRFLRMIREESYDLVIGNPPYLSTSKITDTKYLVENYKKSKADLYSMFLERGLQLAQHGGISALLTMRNWLFIQQFSQIRESLFEGFSLRVLGDLDRGSFEEIPDEVVATVMSVFQKVESSNEIAVAIQPTPLDDNSRDSQRTARKRSALLSQVGRFEFQCDRFNVIKEKPIVYWWNEEFIDQYEQTPKLSEVAPVKSGMQTGDNSRFVRKPWELLKSQVWLFRINERLNQNPPLAWMPYIQGGKGRTWFEPVSSTIDWRQCGLEVKVLSETRVGATIRNSDFFFTPGVAFTPIGNEFTARVHRYRSICDTMGTSVFPKEVAPTSVLLNSQLAKTVLSSLNPTIHFQVGDVNRLPLFSIESADEIFAQLDRAFTEHEAARETSVEFKQPGASAWNYAQSWAQQAVDRPSGTPLPPYEPIYDQPPATTFVSYAIGVALGRFGANGEGILNQASETALPHGILYLSAYSGDRPNSKDSLNHPACNFLKATWKQHSSTIIKKPLRDWLRLHFFKDVHLGLYETRPIYFPLSSSKKNFVAHISIHRWHDTTLQTLLADYLRPELTELEGELSDLLESRKLGDRTTQATAEKRYSEIQTLHTELKDFCDRIAQIAEKGAPPTNAKDTPRQNDARFQLNLDDGVMVNSAALWTLLEPQWSQPKKWWSELCTAQGKKDYDWSHLAARYFRDRVDAKCQSDPSLAVAHGVFWKYHPAKAYEWELRLKDEIAPDFTIDEQDSDIDRKTFEQDNPELVKQLKDKEEKRRERKRKKEDDSLPLFDESDHNEE